MHARAVVARLHAAQADIAAIRAGERGTPAGRAPCRASGPRCCRGCCAGSATSGPASRWSAGDVRPRRAGPSGRDRPVRPVVRADAGGRGPVRGPPDPRRPVRPARPRGLPAGGQHVGDAAPGRPAAADRGAATRSCRASWSAPAADRHGAGGSSSGPTTTRPSRASSPPASATPCCLASPWTRTTPRWPCCRSRRRCRRAGSASVWHVDRQLPPTVHRFVDAGRRGLRAATGCLVGTRLEQRGSLPVAGAAAQATSGARRRRARPASAASRGAPASAAACGARAGRGAAGAGSLHPRPAYDTASAAARARGSRRPAPRRRCRSATTRRAAHVDGVVPTRPSRAMS